MTEEAGMQNQFDFEDFLTEIYQAARKRRLKKIRTLIQDMPRFSDVEGMLKQMDVDYWDRVVRSQKKKRIIRNVIFAVAATIFLALLAIIFFIYGQGKLRIPAAEASLTPTHTMLSTPTNTLLSTSTILPSTTPTSAPTPTHTLIPESAYLVLDQASVDPMLPVQADKVWILDDSQAKTNPKIEIPGAWQLSATSGQEQKSYYYNSEGNFAISWKMDQPFIEEGLYEILILDTLENSNCTAKFDIYLDRSPTNPFRGSSTIIFNDGDSQKQDEWLSLGFYQVNIGQTLSIVSKFQEFSEGESFALDRVMIVKVAEGNYPLIESLPIERILVSLLDDSRAAFGIIQASKFVETIEGWLVDLQNQSWNQSFHFHPGGWQKKVQARWAPLGRLGPGEYELLLWIPAQHATVKARYTLVVNGKELKRSNASEIIQADYTGAWASLGSWTLTEGGAVEVQMTVDQVVTGEIGVDAVALVKVGN